MKRHLINKISLLAGLGIVTAMALMTCAPKNQTTSTSDSTSAGGGGTASVERGKYLVTTSGCGDCHTPFKMGDHGPEPDMNRMLSGHPADLNITNPANVVPPWMASIDMTFTAFSGPWGVSFTANLTPDSLTGLGAWTQDMFVNAIRSGKHMGNGRPILPPMPWPSFKNMTDADLQSMFMYLRTIPAISNKVPDPIAGMMSPGGPGGPPPSMGGAPPPLPKPPGVTGGPPLPPRPHKK